MKTAPALVVSALVVFALMLVLLEWTEAASLVLFPAGALLALAAFASGIRALGQGRARLANATATVVALGLIGLAAAALAWMLWFLGVFGEGWG